MAVESTIRSGSAFTILTDGYNLSGALATATSPTYSYYTGGTVPGTFRTVNGSNVTGTLYSLAVPSAHTDNGVILLTAASGIMAQQFQIFPDGPIKGTAQRVVFLKQLASTGLFDAGTTPPTVEWFVPGSSTPSTLTATVFGTTSHAPFWYVDLTSGMTNVDSGMLRVTGSGLIPLSIPIFFSTASSGGGSTPEGETPMGGNVKTDLVGGANPVTISEASTTGRIYLVAGAGPVLLAYAASGATVAKTDPAFPFTGPFTTFNVDTGKKLVAWAPNGDASIVVVT